MTDARLWPETPLVEEYLNVAAIDHPGHKLLDLAVWYSILQNYVNRNYICVFGQPFRVHFFLVANSSFGKSASLHFGFNDFLNAYRKTTKFDDVDTHFIDLSGQNTAAGLSDVFNAASDTHNRQIATTWIDETVYLFPERGPGKREVDISTLISNILLGKRNSRHVREKISRTSVADYVSNSDCIPNPLVNACFPATPEQYTILMKGGSSSELLKRFILLSPGDTDRSRHPTFMDKEHVNFSAVLDRYAQWQNAISANAGLPEAPKAVVFDDKMKAFLVEKFKPRAKALAAEQFFFRMKQNQVVMLAGLNALSRFDFNVIESDISQAWNVIAASWEYFKRLRGEDQGDEILTTTQKQRRAALKRICQLIEESGVNGISRKEIRLRTYALRYFSEEEADKLFEYLDKEVQDVFSIGALATKKNDQQYTKRLYFSTEVWLPEEAAAALPLAKPIWSNGINGFVDAIGNVHTELTQCIGYRRSWEEPVQ